MANSKVTPISDEIGTTEGDRKELLRQAYGRATQVLRDEYRDRFNALYSEAAEALGVEWKPRLTEEQRAEQQFKELLTAYPHLADKIAAE